MDMLYDLKKSVLAQNLHVRNVVVRQNGNIVAEHNFAEEKSTLLWSVSKSFTSMTVGIALEEGCFKLTDKIVSFFSEEAEGCSKDMQEVTVHDLLCMGVGHEKCPIEKAMENNEEIKNISSMFFKTPVIYKPGTHFVYNNSATYMLSKLIYKTTGQTLLDYSYSRLFEPLNVEKPRWDTDEAGITLGFSGLHLTAHELSKFGQLLLDGGRFEGKQIVPLAYIKQATKEQISTKCFDKPFATEDHKQGYGYQFWMNAYNNSYRMDGMYAQYVVMLPDKNAVVTFVSEEPEKMMSILELTWNTLIDKL